MQKALWIRLWYQKDMLILTAIKVQFFSKHLISGIKAKQ
ncbi:MAG: hypothetical protein CM15mV116_230 [uncultured marine virus]|nr:MAG: hypothetical protein CM15mV116_230 [uncultured marine virus]